MAVVFPAPNPPPTTIFDRYRRRPVHGVGRGREHLRRGRGGPRSRGGVSHRRPGLRGNRRRGPARLDAWRVRAGQRLRDRRDVVGPRRGQARLQGLQPPVDASGVRGDVRAVLPVGPEIRELGTADPARNTRTHQLLRRGDGGGFGPRAVPLRQPDVVVVATGRKGRPEGRGGDQGADRTAGRRQVRQRHEQAVRDRHRGEHPAAGAGLQRSRRSRAGRRGARRRPGRSASSPAAMPAHPTPGSGRRPPRAQRPSCRRRDRRCRCGSRGRRGRAYR